MIVTKAICLVAFSAGFLELVTARNQGRNNFGNSVNNGSSSDTASAVAVSASLTLSSSNSGTSIPSIASATSGSAAAPSSSSGASSDGIDANIAQAAGNANGNASNTSNNNGAGSITLDANAIQTGSQQDGTSGTGVESGEVPSATDPANFINFCSGKQLTNGLQVAGGSCNGIVMGDIPSSGNMISTIITNPGPGDTIAANQDFNINVQVNNLVAGHFTNADSTYYSAPQTLQGGNVVGHTHVTVQSLGNSLATTTPPDASTFAFFKGINDNGNGQGGLTAAVAGGLPAGVYRVCTMTSASNHQPVTMPLAQRGAQDDCNKFTVSDSGTSTASGSGNSTSNAGSTPSSAAANGGSDSTSSASATSASSSSSSTGGNNNGGKKGGNNNRRGRFVLREYIA